MNEIYILGVGHNTVVYMELAELNGYCVKGLYHCAEGQTGNSIHGIKIIGTHDELLSCESLKGMTFALSMGDNDIRLKLAKRIRDKGGSIPTLIHPTAFISKYAFLDKGVVVHSNATIQPEVVIGSETVISFNTGIVHNSIIGKGCYIAGNSIVGAYTTLEDGVFVGQGAIIISGKVSKVGKKSIIGAGSIVTKNVPPYSVLKGNPGRIFNKVK